MVIESKYDLLINGETVPAASESTLKTENPATEEVLTEVAAAKAADVDDAVQSGAEALTEWRSMAPEERGRILNAIADSVRREADRLAEIDTLDSGKPLSQAEADVEGCARCFEYYAGVADKIHGKSIPLTDDYLDYTVREPLGVTAQIIPWNFPIGIFGRSVAPALAAGNVAIVKPAEQTPLSALEVGELAIEAGLPPGVLNVIPGFGTEAGAAIANHPDIDGISFTGSVGTGRIVAKSAVENLTPVHLELGGKSPSVVFPDADLDTAVENTISGLFSANAGQTCSAASRLLVHEDVHAEVVDKLVEQTRELSVGPGIDDPDIGPLISPTQWDTVSEYIEIGRREVGDPIVGEASEQNGHFVKPTIFDSVPNDSQIASEEIFGPVLTVTSFASEDEAIQLANDTEYGLVAGVFTENLGRAHRLARDLQAGQIYINEWFAGGIETPFGGYKQSGFGREKGLEAIRSYTQTKNVCANID